MWSNKITLLRNAREQGFRTYLYFVATDSVELNVRRVHVRVQVGGHAVPEEKICERYLRSLELLPLVVKETDRDFHFDNSANQHVLLAEIIGRKITALHEADDRMPNWFLRFREHFEP